MSTSHVAYPGPPGSHTASAAAALFPSDTLVPLAGFRAVADAVVAAEAGHGVLPIESSLAGPVAETHDLLYERALSIVGETVLPIRHCLAASADVPLDEIRDRALAPDRRSTSAATCSRGCRRRR